MMENEKYGQPHDKSSDSQKLRSSGPLPLEMRFHLESAPIVQCRHHESMCGLAHPHRGRMSWVSSYQKMLMQGALHLEKMPQISPSQNGPPVSSSALLCEDPKAGWSCHLVLMPGALQLGEMPQISPSQNGPPVSSSALLCEDPKAGWSCHL